VIKKIGSDSSRGSATQTATYMDMDDYCVYTLLLLMTQ